MLSSVDSTLLLTGHLRITVVECLNKLSVRAHTSDSSNLPRLVTLIIVLKAKQDVSLMP